MATSESDEDDRPISWRTALMWTVAVLGALVALWTVFLMYLPGGW